MGDSNHYCILQSLFKSQMELAEPQLEPADDHLSQLRRNLKITWRIHQKLVPKAESNGMSTKGMDYHIDKILLPVTFKNCLCFLEFVKSFRLCRYHVAYFVLIQGKHTKRQTEHTRSFMRHMARSPSELQSL